MKLASTPTKKGILKTNSPKLTSTAAKTIGVDNKNEYFAALSLSILKILEIVIVIQERETPGNAAAIACEIPIKNPCLKFILL